MDDYQLLYSRIFKLVIISATFIIFLKIKEIIYIASLAPIYFVIKSNKKSLLIIYAATYLLFIIFGYILFNPKPISFYISTKLSGVAFIIALLYVIYISKSMINRIISKRIKSIHDGFSFLAVALSLVCSIILVWDLFLYLINNPYAEFIEKSLVYNYMHDQQLGKKAQGIGIVAQDPFRYGRNRIDIITVCNYDRSEIDGKKIKVSMYSSLNQNMFEPISVSFYPFLFIHKGLCTNIKVIFYTHLKNVQGYLNIEVKGADFYMPLRLLSHDCKIIHR